MSQQILLVEVHREQELVTLDLAECLPLEWLYRAQLMEDRLSPAALVQHRKISLLVKPQPPALAVD